MHKGVVWYLVLAFAGAWLPWEIAIRSGVAVTSAAFQLYALPGAFAPAIAAVIVRQWITREGFADAGLRLNLRKWRYYLIGWLLPIAVVGFIVAEATLFSIASPNLSVSAALSGLSQHLTGDEGKQITLPAGINPWVIILGQLLISVPLFTPILWGEEFGWRGYLQPRLFAGQPVRAAIGTGLIWAVWHYPLILRGYDYPDSPVLGAAVFAVGTVLISIVFGWLREASGSIWACSLDGHEAGIFDDIDSPHPQHHFIFDDQDDRRSSGLGHVAVSGWPARNE